MSKQVKFDVPFYTLLNNLEERFQQEEAEKDDLEKLILFIAELIQFYDLKKDQIKYYFIEKMQYILSRPYTLSVLKKEKPQATPKIGRHQHNFSLPVLRYEKQAQVQSDLNESFEKIKQLQDDLEQQEKDQVLLIRKDIDTQTAEVMKKINHRKQNKSTFCIGMMDQKSLNQSSIDEESPSMQNV